MQAPRGRVHVSAHPAYVLTSCCFSPTAVCCDHVEGGMYIGPEFQLGQVYDGSLGVEEGETVVLYRPVYVSIRNPTRGSSNAAGASSATSDDGVA
ncbi:hypothetical protein MTO96_017824 [Rhipicephalus appendiculatus]